MIILKLGGRITVILLSGVIVILTYAFNTQFATAAESSDLTICQLAISSTKPKWDEKFQTTIIEAKRRGLSELFCSRLSGRFSESQLRDYHQGQPRKSKVNIYPRQSSKSNSRSSALTAQNRKLNKQIVLQNSKIIDLEKKIEPLNKLTDSFFALRNKLTAIEKNIVKFNTKSKNTDRDNDVILNTIADWQDVMPRLQRKIEALESKLNGAQANLETNQRTLATWQTDIPALKREIARLQGLKIAPRASKNGPQKEVALIVSNFNVSNNLLWLIPGVLLIGVFGIIIIVLVRKNNEMKRQLENSMRYASRKKAIGAAEVKIEAG